MRAAAALLLALACAPGCKSQQPGSVDLTIVADPSLSDATVGSIRSLEIDVSGAVTDSESFVLAQSFSAGRQERIAIRPSVSSGTLTIAVLARSAAGAPVGFGQTDAVLSGDGVVAAQVLLTASVPGDLGTPDMSVDGNPNVPSVRLLAGKVGGIGCVDGTGPAARFNSPRGAVFAGGKLYIADMRNQVIRAIAVDTGTVTTIAGSPLATGGSDGTGAAARFYNPHGITTDGAGNLFVADMKNNVIRKIVIATGAVTTLAGTAGSAGSTDNTGPLARFDRPQGIAYDGAGNLYVADTHNHTIRKVVISSGAVTTLAGTAGANGFLDNTGAAAKFDKPHAIAFHNGNVYVADTNNSVVRQIVASSGVVTTLAGTAGSRGTADGTGGAARFSAPRALVADGAGSLYVGDSDNNSVRKIVEASRVVTTIAGQDYGYNDGIGTGAGLAGPMALAFDGAGTLYVADGWGQLVRKLVLASAQVTTLAGTGPNDGRADGAGGDASFRRPHGLCVVGNAAYVGDKQNNSVRKIDLTSGLVTTLAGGQTGAADGVGSAASFSGPWGIASDGAGNLFVADSGNDTIRQIALATGQVTTLAGTAGQTGTTTNVAGAAARFNGPAGLAYAAGTLYVADTNNHTIRAIDVASQNVTTIAGTAGTTGSKDGTGTGASFNGPVGLAIEGGVLYVGDLNNRTIRSVSLPGAVVGTLAGSAGMTGSADGSGSTARFFMPQGLAGDGAGNLYVADTRNHTLRKIVIATTAVTTVAGTAGIGSVQLGPLPGVLNTPSAVAVAPGGVLLITTTHENAILSIQ